MLEIEDMHFYGERWTFFMRQAYIYQDLQIFIMSRYLISKRHFPKSRNYKKNKYILCQFLFPFSMIFLCSRA